MKKILIIIALAGGLTTSFIGSAQTSIMASRVDYSITEIGDNAIIRNDEVDGTLIYYEDLNGLSYFLYRPTNTSTYAYKYSWIDINYKYSIHDMVMLGDKCYFCGSRRNATYPNIMEGIVGHVDMSHIADQPTAQIVIRYCTIPDTKIFTQMDGTLKNGGRELVCLVGESHWTYAPSCAAFVEWVSSTGLWHYFRTGIYDVNETLTDIAFSGTGDTVVAVSMFANEHNKFGLHGELVSDLFTFLPPYPLTNFSSRHIIDTYGLTLASSSNPNPTWHDDDIVARIVSTPKTANFTVAYECVDNTLECETQRQMAMFQIDISTLTMSVTEQQIVRGYFGEGFTFTDMLYIPDNKTFALLHRSKNGSKKNAATVQFPTWLYFGQINTLISPVALHSSLDLQYTNSNPYLNLAGNRDGDNKICHFWQDLNHIESSCYQTMPLSLSEKLLGNCTDSTAFVYLIDRRSFENSGFTLTYEPTSTEWDNTCYTNHVQ